MNLQMKIREEIKKNNKKKVIKLFEEYEKTYYSLTCFYLKERIDYEYVRNNYIEYLKESFKIK